MNINRFIDRYPGLNPNKNALLERLTLPAMFFCLAFSLYGSTMDIPWLLDDFQNIVFYDNTRDLKSAFIDIFRVRGLAYYSFALNHSVAEFELKWFHCVNIMLHASCCVAAYCLLCDLFENNKSVALLGSIMFLVHPVQTQPVNYIVQRMTLLSAFFFLLSVLFYVRAHLAGVATLSNRYLYLKILSVIFGLFAILSKENAVVLIAILLALDFYYLNKSNFNLSKEVVKLSPYLGLVAVAFVQQIIGHDSTLERLARVQYLLPPDHADGLSRIFSNPSLLNIRYFSTELHVFWIYVKLLLFPYGQIFEYNYPLVVDIVNLKSIFTFLVLIVIAIYVVKIRSRDGLLAFGISWIFIALSVESSFIPLDPIYEHRLYLPMFGFVVVVARLVEKIRRQELALVMSVLILIGLSLLTFNRNKVWAEPLQFWEDNAKKAPHAPRVRNFLAREYYRAGQYDLAIVELEKVLKAFPGQLENQIALGEAYFRAGHVEKAISQFREIKSSHPYDNTFELYLGILASERGDIPSALNYIDSAKSIQPSDIRPLYYRAAIVEKQGHFVDAAALYNEILSRNIENIYTKDMKYYYEIIEPSKSFYRINLNKARQELDRFKHSLAKDPDNLKLRGEYAILLQNIGLYREALDQYQELSLRAKDYWQIYYNSGLILEKLNERASAERNYLKSLSLSRDNPLVLNNLGVLYRKMGKHQNAREVFESAIQVKPDYSDAYFNLAKTCYEMGETNDAVVYFRHIRSSFPQLQDEAERFLSLLEK